VNEDLGVHSEMETEFLPITNKAYPYLSGTSFKAPATGELIEEQIFNWAYTDEPRAKEVFAAKNLSHDKNSKASWDCQTRSLIPKPLELGNLSQCKIKAGERGPVSSRPQSLNDKYFFSVNQIPNLLDVNVSAFCRRSLVCCENQRMGSRRGTLRDS
jgi:hypothetical protein